jgi:hypothetical protein
MRLNCQSKLPKNEVNCQDTYDNGVSSVLAQYRSHTLLRPVSRLHITSEKKNHCEFVLDLF